MSVPKDLYPRANYVPIPLKWLFGDEIIARINNIEGQQKAFKVDKSQKGHLTGKPIFLNKIKKTGRDFRKFPDQYKGNNTSVTKTNRRNSHTRKQETE